MLKGENMSEIIKLKNLNIIDVTPRELPEDIRNGIQANWNKLLVNYPRMFNGPVYSALHMNNDDGKVTLTCELSDYSHYKYSEIRDLGEYACRNTYAGCIVVSSDDRLFVSLNGEGSEFVGKIQVIGGVIDPDDRFAGESSEQNKLSPVTTALRELGEEAGEEIRKSITDIGSSYLVTNGKKYGIHTVVYSELDSKAIYSPLRTLRRKQAITRLISLFLLAKMIWRI